jgi:hypothetical protein
VYGYPVAGVSSAGCLRACRTTSSRSPSPAPSSQPQVPSGRTLLIAAALAGLVTAMPLRIPAGVLIGAAALLLGPDPDCHTPGSQTNRNLLPASGVDTRPLRQEER